MRRTFAIVQLLITCSLIACTLQKKVTAIAEKDLLQNKNLATAHMGICLYEPATNKYWYSYQGDKYFVPASNTKLLTLYAGLKYLGDSIPGIQYKEDEKSIYLQPTGDPTFLHISFTNQPIVKWLQQTKKKVYITDSNWHEQPLGAGWSWDDYNEPYMTERNALPVFGNVLKWTQLRQQGADSASGNMIYSDPEVNWKVKFNPARTTVFKVTRQHDANVFEVMEGKEILKTVEVPFITNGLSSALELLKDTLQKEITIAGITPPGSWKTKYSQPSDSLFRAMIHTSNNFMAEQTLLMLSNKMFGIMNDEIIIDTLLRNEFKGMPQAPTWVDASGLSRYNLFSPNDFVWLLTKMKSEFPWKRITTIFPTGNEGTLSGYYKQLENNIYAKTGTHTGQMALSGFLTTRKHKQLVFSILINNHHPSNPDVKKAIEKFLMDVYEKN